MKELVAKGVFCGGVLETSDCRATYEELRANGVTFLQEPADRRYATKQSSAMTLGTGSA